MFGSLSHATKVSLIALASAVSFIPAIAAAKGPASQKPARVARVEKPRECAKLPVEVVAGKESTVMALAKCDGSASPGGVDSLSILARPAGVARPKADAAGGPIKGQSEFDVAPGIRRIDGRLVERLQQVAEHFHSGAHPTRIVLGNAEGRQPAPSADPHAAVRSLRFRIDHVKGDAVTAYCKTLPETSCTLAHDGHVRMDVRAPAHADAAPNQAPDGKPTSAATPETSDAPAGSDEAPSLSMPAPLSPLPASARPAGERGRGSFFL
jgi:hypothetical protein